MSETKFIRELTKTTKPYSWKILNNTNSGVARNGKTRGLSFDPVSALCRFYGKGTFSNTCKGRKQAASKIGIQNCMLKNVEDSVTAKSNRGHSQTLRGKIRQVLEV